MGTHTHIIKLIKCSVFVCVCVKCTCGPVIVWLVAPCTRMHWDFVMRARWQQWHGNEHIKGNKLATERKREEERERDG